MSCVGEARLDVTIFLRRRGMAIGRSRYVCVVKVVAVSFEATAVVEDVAPGSLGYVAAKDDIGCFAMGLTMVEVRFIVVGGHGIGVESGAAFSAAFTAASISLVDVSGATTTVELARAPLLLLDRTILRL